MKRNGFGKLIFGVMVIALMLGIANAALADDVSSFSGLSAALTNPASQELTINLRNNITLEDEIVVSSNITKLTIYMNGFTIDGDDSYPFLHFKKPCELALKNTNVDSPVSTYLDSDGNLAINKNNMGKIHNCYTSGYGGAVIYFDKCDNVKITLQDIYFNNNVADYGSGGVVCCDGSNCTFTAKGCIFTENEANWFYGGAIYLNDSGTCNISYCEFSSNYCEDFGGALYADHDNTITISHCVFDKNESATDGGVIHVNDNTNLQVDNTVFSNNIASSQGGAIWQGDSITDKIGTGVLNIQDCKFISNNATDSGGAIQYKDIKSVSITGSDFTLNESEYGGAILVDNTKDNISINKCTFTSNSADFGGALDINPEAELSLNNCSFDNNTAQASGGAIQIDEYIDEYGNVSIISCNIENNEALSGGGIYLCDGAHLTVTNGKIGNNTATSLGGGILVVGDNTVFSVNGADISGNKAINKYGQDILLVGDSVIHVAGNLGTSVYDVAKYVSGTHSPGVITSGLSNYGTADNFKSSEGYTVIINSSNEAELVKTYKVTFNSNGGSGSMEKQVFPIGVTQDLTANSFAWEHYSFTGWNTKSDGSGTPYADGASISLTADLTLYAQWRIRFHTISYAYSTPAPAGAPAVPAIAIVNYGASQNVAAAPTLTGYTFSGWSGKTKTDGTAVAVDANNAFTMPDDDVEFTGSWTANSYTVTVTGGTAKFERNGEKIEKAKVGDTVYIYADTGSIPEGKYCSAMVSDQVTLERGWAPDEWFFEMPAENVTVTAEYKGQEEKTFDLTDAENHPDVEWDVINQINSYPNSQYQVLHPDDTALPFEYDFNNDSNADVAIDRNTNKATRGAGADALTDDPELTFSGLRFSPIKFLLLKKYTVTVTNGTGSGEYASGKNVTITANAPEAGMQFEAWTGADGLTFTSGGAATESATFTMPANAVNLTATYKAITHTLTINYVYADNTQAAEPHTETLAEGAEYTVTSPTIEGFTPDQATVSGSMGTEDVTVTVTYAANPAATHTLTINYVYADNTQAAEPHTETLAEGAEYTVTSPTIEGFTPDQATVSGSMGTEDVTVTVTYAANPAATHTLTINYVYADSTQAAEPHTETLAEGAEYAVTSPAIEGFTPDQATVSGNMGTEDVTVTVTYAANPAATHTLTINYVYADNTQAAEPHTETLAEGVEYAVTSPAIEGFTPDQATVSGNMGTEDVTVTVTYAANPAATHTLTINYVYADSTQAAEPHTETLAEGAEYTVTSPTIEGFTPDQATVSGSMGTEDVTVTVTYTANAEEVIQYTVIEGNGQTYVKESGTPLSFRAHRNIDDEKTYGLFKELKADGNPIAEQDYDKKPGSVIATLKPAYLDTLALGKHTLTFVFEDGEAAATFTVTEAAKPTIIPATGFEAVAVPSKTFTFKKVWEGGGEKSIDFTLYKLGDTVYHHGFDKKVISPTEWRYNAWFSEAAACYVIEKPVEGYKTRYENVGVYAGITDRCCDGGTIVNYRVPKTGDDANLTLWLGCALAGLTLICAAACAEKRKKAHNK